jgi:aminopeptidase-like protein
MAAHLTKAVPPDIGERLHALACQLYPLNRSLTGQGVRDTLAAIRDIVPIEVHEVPTGTQVFDWQVPNEWNLREAYIEDTAGRRIVDARDHNLHVVGYSTPVDAWMTLEELIPHLHTLPDHPDWVPYRTSYYKENWGFCLSQRRLEALRDGSYRARIDATLAPGVLNFAEAVIPGESDEEFLISAHICHPSLANDNLSGIGIAAWLGRELGRQRPRYTYRILFAPGTIGAIAWLARAGEGRRRIRHGLIAALLGRPGPMTYKKTRRGDAPIDKAVSHVFRERRKDDVVNPFSPWGYDERQYNSPGIDLPVGRLTRASEGAYPEYHTSADNLDLITAAALEDSFRAFCAVIDVLEHDVCYENLKPFGEPQLGKYGLYDDMGGASSVQSGRLALLWVLNLSDGSHGLLDIAQRSELPFADIEFAASRLERAGLIRQVTAEAGGH